MNVTVYKNKLIKVDGEYIEDAEINYIGNRCIITGNLIEQDFLHQSISEGEPRFDEFDPSEIIPTHTVFFGLFKMVAGIPSGWRQLKLRKPIKITASKFKVVEYSNDSIS